MEELQMLVTMVAGLPTLTVWVLAGYLLYRLVVIGSIYGVIRLFINRYHNYKTRPKEFVFAGKFIDEEVAQALRVQVARAVNSNSNYIHMSDVVKLRKALDLIDRGDVK